eukprot:g1487.t1
MITHFIGHGIAATVSSAAGAAGTSSGEEFPDRLEWWNVSRLRMSFYILCAVNAFAVILIGSKWNELKQRFGGRGGKRTSVTASKSSMGAAGGEKTAKKKKRQKKKFKRYMVPLALLTVTTIAALVVINTGPVSVEVAGEPRLEEYGHGTPGLMGYTVADAVCALRWCRNTQEHFDAFRLLADAAGERQTSGFAVVYFVLALAAIFVTLNIVLPPPGQGKKKKKRRKRRKGIMKLLCFLRMKYKGFFGVAEGRLGSWYFAKFVLFETIEIIYKFSILLSLLEFQESTVIVSMFILVGCNLIVLPFSVLNVLTAKRRSRALLMQLVVNIFIDKTFTLMGVFLRVPTTDALKTFGEKFVYHGFVLFSEGKTLRTFYKLTFLRIHGALSATKLESKDFAVMNQLRHFDFSKASLTAIEPGFLSSRTPNIQSV